jgi:hypothetical protein
MNPSSVLTALLVLGAVLLTPAATAQELEVRTYANIPIGVNFIAFGTSFSQGDILLDPAVPVAGLDARINAAFARYVHSFSLFGLPSKVSATLPVASGEWKAFVNDEFRSRDVTGLGDARIAIATIFAGAPALRKSEFAGYRQGRVFGASLDLIMPTGDYDSSYAANLGTNRWTLNPEIGMSQPLGEKWILELALAAGIFGTNDDFYGGDTLEQDPLIALKGNIIRQFRPGMWLGFAFAYGWGGQATIGGFTTESLQSNVKAGITFAVPLSRQQGLVFNLASGFTFRAGPDFDTIAVAYQVSWGGS